MKVKNNSKYTRLCSVLLIGVFSVLMSACSELTKKDPLPEAEACNRLNEVIADHPNQFAKYKKNKKEVRHFSVWLASSPFPTAKNCEIWQWSSGLHSFICEWQGKYGESSAKRSYEDGNRILQSCLGDQWQGKSNPTTTGGQNTRYSKKNVETMVSVRYFKSKGLFEQWSTVLYIGDENNLKAKTQ